MTIRQIVDASDARWDEWWNIYSTSFPPDELEDLVYFQNLFRRQKALSVKSEYVLSMEGDSGDVAGIAVVECGKTKGLSFLWYIATKMDMRGQGLGIGLYEFVVGLCRSANSQFMVIEVDLPNDDPKSFENRRIEWYRRQGAKRVLGVDYLQAVSTSSVLVPMALMVHELHEGQLSEIYRRLKASFKTRLQKTGPIRLA